MKRVLTWFNDRFWFVPFVCALGAAALALGLTAFDDWVATHERMPFLFQGGPEGARSVLSAIITSMISFTGLVFSITIVVLQLTSQQFSPRVLRLFLRDRFDQFALGTFIATFVYALLVLRSVRGVTNVDPFVPQVAVTVASVFVLASVVVFLYYISHMAQSIRAASIITRIAEDTVETLERHLPTDRDDLVVPAPPVGSGITVHSRKAGVVQGIADGKLLHLAKHNGTTIRLLRSVGDFVPCGAPLLEVYGGAVDNEAKLARTVKLGHERSPDEDVGFGLRQLVDIAEKALSPGINDPTTAVQSIDYIHDLLRRLAIRPLVARQRFINGDRLAVHIPEPDFETYLFLAVDELADLDDDMPRVEYRLCVMLNDLLEIALEDYRPLIIEAREKYCPRYRDTWQKTAPQPTDVGIRNA